MHFCYNAASVSSLHTSVISLKALPTIDRVMILPISTVDSVQVKDTEFGA